MLFTCSNSYMFTYSRCSSLLSYFFVSTDHWSSLWSQESVCARRVSYTRNLGELVCTHPHTPHIIVYQDTAGSERYESMSRIYYRGAKAAIVCFGETKHSVSVVLIDLGVYIDLTDSSSFDRAKFWVNELKQTEEV